MTSSAIRNLLLLALSSTMAASAQMIVHAVSGTVKAVTPESISVSVDGGPPSAFAIIPSPPSLAFPGDLRSAAASPASFQKVGDFAVVYYYGWGSDRTAVAVKDLGAGPFTKLQGSVASYDKHTRQVTLKDPSGKEVSLQLDGSLIVDTDQGVDSGRKFQPHKGDQVRVTYGSGSPATVALLGEKL